MKKYGELPKVVGEIQINCDELMFYHSMLVKLAGVQEPVMETRLDVFKDILGKICCDYIAEYGIDSYMNSNVYFSAKKLYQEKGSSFNRKGYHSDGFMSDDINYIWYDSEPTIFNNSDFKITLDDTKSMVEMDEQALKENEYLYPNNTVLRLNQYQIHKVSASDADSLRVFVKVTFSKDIFNLKGNTINPLIDYNWDFRERSITRNIPQNIKK